MRCPRLVGVLMGVVTALPGAVRAQIADGTNLAPLTSYDISPPPNYALATGVPGKVLSDGSRAWGRFWVGSGSIGWYWKSPVVFRQTFEKALPIRRVEIGSGQNLHAEIALPSNAFVYGRVSNGAWIFLGDAARTIDGSGDGVHLLSLDVTPVAVVAVSIVLYRDAPYVFLDEVRILAATAAHAGGNGEAVPDVEADAATRRRAYAEMKAGAGPLGDTRSTRFAWPLEDTSRTTGGCAVIQVSPWTESTAAAIAAAPADSAARVSVVDGWLNTAVRIDNHMDRPARLDIGAAASTGAEAAEVFVAGYVIGLDYRWRADVLTPTDGIVVPPRSRVLLQARAHVTAAGTVAAAVHLTCDGRSTDVAMAGQAVAISAADRPYGNAWSYLQGPARDLVRCRTDLHRAAWIDTAVVDASALGPVRTARNNDELRSYVQAFAGAQRLLLYMDVTDAAWVHDDTPALERQLTTWWSAVSRVISDQGYAGQVLFYPVDEVSEAQLGQQTTVARLLRRIAPQIQIFATIDNLAAAFGADADVRQFHNRILNRLPAAAPRGSSPQLYATANYSKTLGLEDYYRRLGWLALGVGFRGAGIWSMWDANGADKPEIGWTDFGGTERDFNLIYAGVDGCPLPSRRLFAFQRGLEDFAVLSACQGTADAATLRTEVRALAHAAEWEEPHPLPGMDEVREAPALDVALASLAGRCSKAWGYPR